MCSWELSQNALSISFRLQSSLRWLRRPTRRKHRLLWPLSEGGVTRNNLTLCTIILGNNHFHTHFTHTLICLSPPQCVRTAGGYGSHCGRQAGRYQIYGKRFLPLLLIILIMWLSTFLQLSATISAANTLQKHLTEIVLSVHFFIFVLSVHEDRRHLCRGRDRCHRLLLSLRGTPLHDAGLWRWWWWWWWWWTVLSSKLAWEETSCLRHPQLQPILAEPVNALGLRASIDEKHEDDRDGSLSMSRNWWSCVSIKKSGGSIHPHCCRWTTKRSASATKRTSFSAS